MIDCPKEWTAYLLKRDFTNVQNGKNFTLSIHLHCFGSNHIVCHHPIKIGA